MPTDPQTYPMAAVEEKTLQSGSKAQASKQKIERAAIALFAEHSIDGVTTKQIAKAAGLSEGSIYRHFSSKDDLARAAMVSIHTQLTDMIREAALKTTIEAKVNAIVSHYCTIADSDWDLFRYHILHLHHFPKLSDLTQDNPLAAAADLLHTAMMEDEIPMGDSTLLASMALGIVLQPAQTKVLGLLAGPLSPHIPLFTRKILALLGAHPNSLMEE